MELDDNIFFEAADLLDRLSAGLSRPNREVIFVVGAPLTAPYNGEPGVDDVRSVLSLIRQEFSAEEHSERAFDTAVHTAENQYQAAFRFLQGRRGQDAANRVIRKAVLNAHKVLRDDRSNVSLWDDKKLSDLAQSAGEWSLSPGVAALGRILSIGSPFSPLVVTSNFDPLIEISIRQAGGHCWRTSLHSDGDISQSKADGCQVLHIHGFWEGNDTLHTGNQLLQQRPFLRNSLLKYMADKLVVVMAYGGWQDVFTGALQSLVSDVSSYPEILWTFYDSAPQISPHLQEILKPGITRNRVTLYRGIDCNTFLPALLDSWVTRRRSSDEEPFIPVATPAPPPTSRPSSSDRPPSVDAWVGRESELRSLEVTTAPVVIISGIGGQGKSTLAAQYLLMIADGTTPFTQWDWRDCKEEGDRVRTQLIAAIDRMASNDLSLANNTLAPTSDSDIVEMFISIAERNKCVFVFDNVDSYVDLEKARFVGILDRLVQEFSRIFSSSRIIITCRPRVSYDISSVVSIPLKGLSLDDAVELFKKRVLGGETPLEDIRAAHGLTEGHAFWLDMMAVQVGRVPGTTLKTILEDFRRGRGGPAGFLESIWKTLPEREKVVLRGMAETMRPESEVLIAQVVSGSINFKNFKRALKSLINLNLIVVKPERNSPDLYDLHPLVRRFVRLTFDQPERVGYIKTVLIQYGNIISGIAKSLGVHLPFNLLERWSQKAELEIEAGMMAEAIATLYSAEDALIGGGHTEEFVRVARKIFERNEWMALSALPMFDELCAVVIPALSELEEYDDAEDMIDRYEQTVAVKTSRYIKFCDIKAYYLWLRGRFTDATEWAKRGVDLKTSSDVDTHFDSAHTLALAQRDGGSPALALEYFLKGQELTLLLDPSSDDVDDAPLLGNVGRCLQLMKREEDALICYRKSARILERDPSRNRLSNQAYARDWIAETLLSNGSFDLARAFWIDAERLIRTSIPSRARLIRDKLRTLPISKGDHSPSEEEARRLVISWLR